MNLPHMDVLGLSEKETLVYNSLLELGEKPAGFVARACSMKRSSTYKALYDLESKGLVEHRLIGKKIHFRLQPPERLLTLSQQRMREQEKNQQHLVTLLPELTSAFILSIERPVVTTFEGVKGLKEIYEDTLREKKTIYAALLPSEVNPDLLEYLRNNYRVRRAKLGIHAFVLASSNRYSEEYLRRSPEFARTVRIIPGDRYPFTHEIDIYGNKVAFINYKKGEQLIGVVINHPQIARTMKSLWDIAWDGANALFPAK